MATNARCKKIACVDVLSFEVAAHLRDIQEFGLKTKFSSIAGISGGATIGEYGRLFQRLSSEKKDNPAEHSLPKTLTN